MSEWETIDTAPKDGTRVRVGHELDPSSMKGETICPTHGQFENGQWELDSYFVCTDMRLRTQPTHWMTPAAREGATK